MSICILVIDDEEVIRKLFISALERKGYQVKTAESGEQGIKKAQETKFNLIFIDLKMPGINGVETLRELWKMGQTVPIYIITAYYDDFIEQLQSAANDGISFQLIEKPVNMDEILSIAEIIAEHKLQYSG